jgi:UDP-N-acetylmuramate dehydrogenase
MTAPSLVRCQAVEAARALLGPIAVRDAPLGPLTTYRVGGSAALLVRPRTIDELAAVGRAVASVGLPLLIVGRGSNLLIADTGFPGIAVTLADLATEIVLPDGFGRGELVAVAGGAVALPTLARRTAAAGLTGFEWAVGVPGSIGGAVRMNAGGHGSDMASCLVDVDVVDLGTSEPVERTYAVLTSLVDRIEALLGSG